MNKPDYLKDLKELVGKVASEPWRAFKSGSKLRVRNSSGLLCTMVDKTGYEHFNKGRGDVLAEFIATSRTAIPFLIEVVEETLCCLQPETEIQKEIVADLIAKLKAGPSGSEEG